MKYKWKIKDVVDKTSEDYEYTEGYLQKKYPKSFNETISLYENARRDEKGDDEDLKSIVLNDNMQIAYESFVGIVFGKERATELLAQSFINGYGIPKGNDYLIKLTIKIGINLGDSYCTSLSSSYNFNNVATLANQLVKEIKLNTEILEREEINWGQAFIAAEQFDKIVKNSSDISYFDYVPRNDSLPKAQYTVNIEPDTSLVGESSAVANENDGCCIIL